MKFTIRDLILVTVIVAVCTAWWLDRSKLASELNKLKSPWQPILRVYPSPG